MNFTIIAEKVIKSIKIKNLTIDFICKGNFDNIKEIEKVSGVGGYYFISTPELTVIDLVQFQKRGGYLNNAYQQPHTFSRKYIINEPESCE